MPEKTTQKKILRCAVYTRKSTEEGLDMEYNTLDAQREAGEKYIEAMRHEGWRVIPEEYNDGGYSGGNMDRPGLQKLMADIGTTLIVALPKWLSVLQEHNVPAPAFLAAR